MPRQEWYGTGLARYHYRAMPEMVLEGSPYIFPRRAKCRRYPLDAEPDAPVVPSDELIAHEDEQALPGVVVCAAALDVIMESESGRTTRNRRGSYPSCAPFPLGKFTGRARVAHSRSALRQAPIVIVDGVLAPILHWSPRADLVPSA
jgi:hypothetical protein